MLKFRKNDDDLFEKFLLFVRFCSFFSVANRSTMVSPIKVVYISLPTSIHLQLVSSISHLYDAWTTDSKDLLSNATSIFKKQLKVLSCSFKYILFFLLSDLKPFSFIYLPVKIFSNVSNINDIRLIGLKTLVESCPTLPGFEMNVVLYVLIIPELNLL